jgi:hypothetical protein
VLLTSLANPNSAFVNAEGESGGRRHNFKASGSFDFRRDRVELSVDVYNLTNANTVFAVRTTTGQTPVRVNGDPTQPTTLITTFLSPTHFLSPRVVRFNVTYNFNRR